MGVYKTLFGAAVITAFGLFAATTVSAAPDPNFHIYIAYGQSNMEGNATNFDKNKDGKEHPRVKMFATTSCPRLNRPTVGEMYPATPPMFKCDQGLSVADWFGRHMADSMPDVTIGIVPVAQGGTSIRLFDPDDYKNYVATAADWLRNGVNGAYDGNALGRLIDVAKKAQEKGVIKGIIFHQGETDGGMSNWEQVVKKSYEYILKQLNLNAEDVPFVAGEMVDGGSCAGFNSRVHKLKDYIANFSYASSKGYSSKGDGLHFTVEGYRGMGQRYAQEMLKLISREPVEPVPQEPYKGMMAAIPGKIEVENYDKPGVGAGNGSYSDTDSENQGKSTYRDGDGVDLYNEGTGVVLGMTQAGEWLEYTVDVKAAGKYKVSASVSSGNASSSFKLSLDSAIIGSTVQVPQTGDNKWDVYQDVDVGEVELTAGKHLLRLDIVSNYVNIDYFEFKDAAAAAVVTQDPVQENPGQTPAQTGEETPGQVVGDVPGQSVGQIPGDQLPAKLVNVEFNATDVEAGFQVFDLMGTHVASFRARNMGEAVQMWKQKSAGRANGTYMIRSTNGKTVKVVNYEH